MDLNEQLKHNTNEYVSGRGIKLRVKKNKVKTKKLVKDLHQLRSSFADWDDQRRKKVDLVLNAIDNKQKYIDYEQTKSRLVETAKGEELLPAALKMLNLHYLDLSMTIREKYKMWRRTMKARKKLRRLRRDGYIK